MLETYECICVDDDPGGPYQATFKSGGDVVRLECPPHLFGKFKLGVVYVLTLRKAVPHEIASGGEK